MHDVAQGPQLDMGIVPIFGPSCHSHGIVGYGNPNADVMFIGISPAREEMNQGIPLVGPSGRLLDALLEAVGYPRALCYATNLGCWYKKSGEPTPDDMAPCAPRLKEELKLIKPKLIVLLGSTVTEIVTELPFKKMRSAVQWSPALNCYVMATYHPAAILHAMSASRTQGIDTNHINLTHDLVRDLLKIRDIVAWGPCAPEAQLESFNVINDSVIAQQILDAMPSNELVALDVETSSKAIDETDIYSDRLLCVGLGTAEDIYVFTRQALFAEDDRTPVLTWPTNIKWTFHNALFDVQVMKRALNADLIVSEDTMLMSYTLDERQGVHGLKRLAREYLAAPFYEEERKYGGLQFHEVPKPILYTYNAHDVAYTARLAHIFRERQIADDVRSVYESLLIPAVNVFKEIQFRGTRIDKSLLREFGVQWYERWLVAEEELRSIAREISGQDILLTSPKQLSNLLYGAMSLPGGPSTAQAILETLVDHPNDTHHFIKKLLNFRHLEHMLNIYIRAMQGHIKDDGKVHAQVKLHGTTTGRLAYSNPPLQTIPRPYMFEADFGRLRELFIPTNPKTHVIVEVDYGKAEVWMGQYYSQDPQMKADLLSGDYHKQMASSYLKKPTEDITPAEKALAKTVTFGIMYGREAKSLSHAIGTNSYQAQQYINNFFKRNADYAKYYKDIQDQIKSEGEIVSAFGRKRRIIILDEGVRALKQAVNFPVQSTTSDCTLSSLIELHYLLKPFDAYILFTVHDSIIFEVPKKHGVFELCMSIIHDVMTRPRLKLPNFPHLPVEIKVGESWGTTRECHDCAKEDMKCIKN